MKDSIYSPKKSNQVKNFLKSGAIAGGIVLGSLLNPNDAYSQKFNASELTDQQKIVLQRGVLKPYFSDSTDTHYIFRFGLNSELERAIKNTKNPKLNLMGEAAKGSYAQFSPDSSAVDLHYSKKHIGENGLGKVIGIDLLHEGGSINICEPYIPGSKSNHLSSLYWSPQVIKSEIKLPGDTIKSPPIIIPRDTLEQKSDLEKKVDIDINITQDNSTTIYGDTTKTKPSLDLLKTESDYRFIAEAGKFISKPFTFIGGAIQRNLGKDFWLGIYGRKNLGISKKETHEDFNITTPLEPSIGLETNSTGFVRTTSENSRPFEGGILASYAPGILSFDLGFGAMQDNTYSNTMKKGFDNISQNGRIIEEKPFCVLTEEQQSQLNYLIKADINANIISGVSLGLEGRVNNLFRKPNVEAAVKASIELGGCKNRKSLIGRRNKNEN